MKVMRLLSSLKHDESERGIFHLGRALVKRGHTSIIVSSADKEHELVKRLERDGNIYHQLSLEKKSWMALRQIWPLRQLIEKYQPDIIHLHSRTPAWILHWALKGAKVKHKPKLVSTMYGFYPLNNYSRALLNVDCTITVSDSVSEYLLEGIKEVKNRHAQSFVFIVASILVTSPTATILRFIGFIAPLLNILSLSTKSGYYFLLLLAKSTVKNGSLISWVISVKIFPIYISSLWMRTLGAMWCMKSLCSASMRLN